MGMIQKIALTLIKNVGHVTAKALLGHFGSPERIFEASKEQLMEVPGVGQLTAREILNRSSFRTAEQQIAFVERNGVRVLFYTDEDYPKRLRNCDDAPVLLYYKGNANLNRPRMISVVGTRNATEYGRQICRELAVALAPYDATIVSGMAYGIDIAAHQESLNAHVPTIGVLAHGLDRIYPSGHFGVAQKMIADGGLITEFPLFTSPEKENFPKRNRIIAGMTDATIVVEAAAKGGALITADIANSYARDVYAFPGRTTDRSSAGCNFLIKTNQAGLISCAEDLIHNLGWEPTRSVETAKGTQVQLPLDLLPEEQSLMRCLARGALDIDQIALEIALPQSKIVLHLLNLEMNGLITALPGKSYRIS